MITATAPYRQLHLRHGESIGNVGSGFGGGRPQVRSYTPVQALHEVYHGSAERSVPRPSREAVIEQYERNVRIIGGLLARHAGVEQARYAGWITPTGFGDGESYLEAALRVSGAIDEQGPVPNALFIGHNGSLRQARVLCRYFSRAERRELAKQYAAVSAVRQEMRAAITARPEHTDKDLSTIFEPDTAAASEIVSTLQAAGLPLTENVIGNKQRVGNGQFVEVEVELDGKWSILRRLCPTFPKEERPLRAESVGVEVLPFEITSDSQAKWW